MINEYVLAWTKIKPTKRGFYLNRQQAGASIDTIYVVSKPNGDLIGSVDKGSDFFNKCNISDWIGEWYGPIPL
jgi:hypothetical protein